MNETQVSFEVALSLDPFHVLCMYVCMSGMGPEDKAKFLIQYALLPLFYGLLINVASSNKLRATQLSG